MNPSKIALIVGSNRRESINRLLGRALTRLLPVHFDVSDVQIDDLPMYNADLNPDQQDTVKRFKAEIARCAGVLFVMPEHNRSLPAVLKNAIDWGSKPFDANVWRDKVVAITGTSPGAIGTAVGQQHLRQIMGILGSTVMGGEAYIQFKPGLVDLEGNLADDSTRAFLKAYLDRFAALVERLSPSHAA